MSELKNSLKSAGLIGSFGQIIGTGKATEEWCIICETCTSCNSSCAACNSSCTACTSCATVSNCSISCATTCISMTSGC